MIPPSFDALIFPKGSSLTEPMNSIIAERYEESKIGIDNFFMNFNFQIVLKIMVSIYLVKQTKRRNNQTSTQMHAEPLLS